MGIMCAMNRVNETLSCENDVLLTKYLKTSIGFPGVVVPDQMSQETSYNSANAGMSYSMLQYSHFIS
jgi:beta-glucosidase